MLNRYGSAAWNGNFEQGSGLVSTQTGALQSNPFGAKSRFEEGVDTNPEELIGAAHASCYSMALSLFIGKAGFTPEEIETRSTVTLDKVGDGFAITKIHLDTSAVVPNMTDEEFQKVAESTKEGCPISKLLKSGAEITLTAKLLQAANA